MGFSPGDHRTSGRFQACFHDSLLSALPASALGASSYCVWELCPLSVVLYESESFRAAFLRSSGTTIWYLINTVVVRCPVIACATRWEMPTFTMLRTALRHRLCGSL